MWMCFNEKSCLWYIKKLITQKLPRIQSSTLLIKDFLRLSAFQWYRGQGVWLLGKLAKEAPKNEGWFVEIANFGTLFEFYFLIQVEKNSSFAHHNSEKNHINHGWWAATSATSGSGGSTPSSTSATTAPSTIPCRFISKNYHCHNTPTDHAKSTITNSM